MLKKVLNESFVTKAHKLLDKADKIVVICHENPDGDAIGSSLALYSYLLQLDKVVDVVTPNEIPEFLRHFKGTKQIVNGELYAEFAAQLLQEADLIFCLDFNDPLRVGKLKNPLVESNAKKILIDHHPDPKEFCDVTFSHPQVCATGELVFRLICRLGDFERINKAIAEAIFLSIFTDTGGFAHNADSEQLYYIVWQLIQKGVNKSDIHELVYNNQSLSQLKLKGYLLNQKIELIAHDSFAIMTLTDEEAQRLDYKEGDTEGIVNYPLSIKGVRYSVFLRETPEKVRISFRSKGNYPINEIAATHFHGGGHRNAAGGSFWGSIEEAVVMLKQVAPNYIK